MRNYPSTHPFLTPTCLSHTDSATPCCPTWTQISVIFVPLLHQSATREELVNARLFKQLRLLHKAPLLIKQRSGVLVYKGAPPQSHPSHCVELHTVVSSFPGWRRIHTFRANNMDFNGTWQVYAQENYEEFLKAMGKRRGRASRAAARVSDVPLVWNFSSLFFAELPADVIKMAKDIKPITEIKQSGNDFVVTSKTPGKTVTNSFTIGKESEITTMDGKKLKVCPSWAQNLRGSFWNIILLYMFVFCCIFVKFIHAWCCKWQLGDDAIVMELTWSYYNYSLPHDRLFF